MEQTSKHIIGVMSGTSLDGIDIAHIRFDTDDAINFKIINADTISYNDFWKNRLKGGFHLSGEDLTLLNADYGIFLGETIKVFIEENELKNIDFIASHGHTIFHNPKKKYTLQIGNGPYISSITGIKTICDFRTQDISLGGQGAPLVPIGDELLFSKYDYCLNLGGFSNISLNENNQRIAFDICPVNIVLNHYVSKINLEFDDKGSIASSGKINEILLDELNALNFYNSNKPKSLGFEFIVGTIFPIIDKYKIEINDILRTFVEHIAIQITKKIDSNSSKKVLVTGGGAFNLFLIERIKHYTNTEIIIPNNLLINYKEALIFGLLGLLKEQGENNCLKSVTGAKQDHSSGVVYEV